MAQIFHPSMNIVAKATIFGALFILAVVAWAGGVLVRSSYITGVDTVRDQPIPFSHQHHVSELGLDCRYCHTSVEKSAFAGMPSTEICMGCHSQIWKTSDILSPLRESQRNEEPISWTRVNDLPDFVYFNHSIHVGKEIGCESCHGRVHEMPLMRRASSLLMEWCIDCHRHPDGAVRSGDAIYQFQPRRTGPNDEVPVDRRGTTGNASSNGALERPPKNAASPGRNATEKSPEPGTGLDLVQQYCIVTRQLTDCVICHR